MSHETTITLSDVRAALVAGGLASAVDMARAEAARVKSGGPLAMHLVLLGVVDEGALAAFFAELAGIPRLTPEELLIAGPDEGEPPFEAAYEEGFIPFRASRSAGRLVAMLDPVSTPGLVSRDVSAGGPYNLRVCAVTEFAEIFEIATSRPWRVLADEVHGSSRPLAEGPTALEDELQDLFAAPRGAAVSIELVDDVGDDDVVALGPVSGGASVITLDESELLAASSIDLVPISDSVDLAPASPPRTGGFTMSASYAAFGPNQTLELEEDDVVGERPSSGAVVVAVELLGPDDEIEGEVVDLLPTATATDEPIDLEAPATEPTPKAAAVDDVVAVDDERPRYAVGVSKNITQTIHGIEPGALSFADLIEAGVHLVGDEGVVPTRIRTATDEHVVSPISETAWDDMFSAAELSPNDRRTPTTGVPAVLAAESASGSLLREHGDAGPVLGSGGGATLEVASPRHLSRSMSIPQSELTDTPRTVPTVGEILTSDITGRFFTSEEFAAATGPPSDATRAVFMMAESALGVASDRDGIARQLVETMAFAYPTVLLLSLRPPDVAVWDGVLATGADGAVGLEFSLMEGSIWHRVAADHTLYVGPVPATDPLRRALPRAFGNEACVVPLAVRERVVALLVLDAGPGQELACPGESVFELAGWVEKALKRVIVRRKNSGRSREA